MPKCFFCGADTPTQWRRPGLLSQLPEHLRGRFSYCPDHIAEADAKIAAAIGVDTRHAPDGVSDRPRESLAGKPGKGGPDRGRGKGGDNSNSQGSLF